MFLGIFFYCHKFLEPNAYDFFVKLTATKPASSDIVTVEIDDQSIAKIGRWPWHRTYYSDMIEYLEKYGNAKVIAFDSVIISNNNNNSNDKNFINKIKNYKKLILGIFFSKQNNSFNFDNEEKLNFLLKQNFSLNVNDSRSKNIIRKSNYLSSSYTLTGLLENVSNIGSVSAHPDKDGIIRKFEPIYNYKGSYYLSLPLAVYSQINKTKSFNLNNRFINSENNLKMPIFSNFEGSFAYIKWYKPLKSTAKSHKSYSAWEIIKSYEAVKNGQKPILDPNTFKNKIVVIGATSTALKDIRSTPISSDYPGVDIQATCIDNILHNDFMIKPSSIISFAILLAIIIVLFIAITMLPPSNSAFIATFMILCYFELCLFCYTKNLAIDIITPEVIIVYSLTIGYGFNFLIENKSKNEIKNIMAKYVSSDVMNDILKDIQGAKLGGKRAEVTILFADIRNFTGISESLPPEKVSYILNTYFSAMVPIILKHHGMLNKFMGDAILAVFGAPVENDKHPEDAINCAMEMMDKLEELRKKWNKEGQPHIDIGIGINTGIAFVGNIGSEDRLEYTVIGDTVNIAYRLDSLNKQLNTRLLISEYTYERIKSMIEADERANINLKGKSTPINVYEVKSLKIIDYDKSFKN